MIGNIKTNKKGDDSISYSALDIATIIINKQIFKNKPITNLQLQKLLFYCQKHYIEYFGEVLFEDEFELTKYGFKISDVYYKYNLWGCCDLIDVEAQIHIDDKANKLIDIVLDYLSGLSTWELLSMNVYEPLYEKYKDRLESNETIYIDNKELLKYYFKN